jgi:hypothetical protein
MTKVEIAKELYLARINGSGGDHPSWDELSRNNRGSWLAVANKAAQLYGNDMATPEKVYHVTTEGDCEGRSIRNLGFASGEIADIEAFYQPQKTYEIYIKEITVKEITPQSAAERDVLIYKKKELEKELETIKNQLK